MSLFDTLICVYIIFDELIQFQNAVKSNFGVRPFYLYCVTFPSAEGLILHLHGFTAVSCTMHHMVNTGYQCSIYTFTVPLTYRAQIVALKI